MESLHRQVLPFLLRRMKEDVLKDLPPKIIQDYYCELSPLQVRKYMLLMCAACLIVNVSWNNNILNTSVNFLFVIVIKLVRLKV